MNAADSSPLSRDPHHGKSSELAAVPVDRIAILAPVVSLQSQRWRIWFDNGLDL
jgi:hypothetical protein